MKYRFVEDLTSDVMFEAFGKSLKELFENSAEALFSVICSGVQPKAQHLVKVNAGSLEELMLNWLQGLIALVDTEEMFFSKFVIKEIDETHLVAECFGEPITPEKGGTVVKAVTYYKFKLEQGKKGFKAVVSLDI